MKAMKTILVLLVTMASHSSLASTSSVMGGGESGNQESISVSCSI